MEGKLIKRFDASAIKSRLLDRMRVKLNWALLSEDGTVSAVLDTFADSEAELARYMEYLLGEKKWTTAQNISSLNSQAKLIGRKSRRARSAIGYVIISHTDENGVNRLANYGRTFFDLDAISNYDDITKDKSTIVARTQALAPWTFDTAYGVPAYSRLLTAGGIEYISTAPVVSRTLKEPWSIISNDTTKYQNFLTAGGWNGIKYLKVPVIQGKLRSTVLGIAQGARFESFVLSTANCEDASNSVSSQFLKILVNTTPSIPLNAKTYVPIANILLAGPLDLVFEAINLPDYSGVIFKFGDGVSGSKLPIGAEVTVNYLETLGTAGNISQKYQITSLVYPTGINMVDPRTQSVSNFLAATNSTAILGGKDAENEEDIRQTAPTDYLQYYSIATTDAYEKQILQYAPVGLNKVKVFSGEKISTLNTSFIIGTGTTTLTIPSYQPVLYVTAISSSGDKIEDAELQFVTPVTKAIGDLKSPSDIITYIEPNFINLRLNAIIYSKESSISDSEIRTTETQALLDKYSVFNMEFKTPFYNSAFIHLTKSFSFAEHTDTFIEALAAISVASTSRNVYISSQTTAITTPTGVVVSSYPILYKFQFNFDKIFSNDTFYQGFKNYKANISYLLKVDLTFPTDAIRASSLNRTFFLFDNRISWNSMNSVPTVNDGKFLDLEGSNVISNQSPFEAWLRPEETLENFSKRALRVAQFPYITSITSEAEMVSKYKTFTSDPHEIRPYKVDSLGNNRLYNVSEVTWDSATESDPRVILPGGLQCYVKDSRYINYMDITFTEDYETPNSDTFATGYVTLPASYFQMTNVDATTPSEFLAALSSSISIKVSAHPLLENLTPSNWNDIIFVKEEDILVQRVLQ